jgi:hypothetical protein
MWLYWHPCKISKLEKMTVLWDVALCLLLEIDRHFRGAYSSVIRVFTSAVLACWQLWQGQRCNAYSLHVYAILYCMCVPLEGAQKMLWIVYLGLRFVHMWFHNTTEHMHIGSYSNENVLFGFLAWNYCFLSLWLEGYMASSRRMSVKNMEEIACGLFYSTFPVFVWRVIREW